MKPMILVSTMSFLLLTCAPIAAFDREKRLRVMISVHANEHAVTSGKEKHEREPDNCVDDGTRTYDPICASNGNLYLNMNRFKYKKCLMNANCGEDITIVDPEFCKDVRLEDFTSEGLM
ncbi:unnamed protein product [Peronospora belbahrii]|uniref:Kazal-like domain-containing protein n=1 Tax=Peronospora belbahrii TaxID=622444 RepID=A0AAU9KRX1_9STRA|nr:unnamed protein product [Peronospora belbahrii]CAH0516615.1 unnamed protein product [Peronospora belbahrii]